MTDKMDEFVAFVKLVGCPTFREIEDEFPDFFGGDCSFGMPEKNILYWVGLSEIGASSIDAAVRSKAVGMRPTHILTYFADGRILNLPLARTLRMYKKPHWIPVAFYPVKGVD
jgi:hypothetical protein